MLSDHAHGDDDGKGSDGRRKDGSLLTIAGAAGTETAEEAGGVSDVSSTRAERKCSERQLGSARAWQNVGAKRKVRER